MTSIYFEQRQAFTIPQIDRQTKECLIKAYKDSSTEDYYVNLRLDVTLPNKITYTINASREYNTKLSIGTCGFIWNMLVMGKSSSEIYLGKASKVFNLTYSDIEALVVWMKD